MKKILLVVLFSIISAVAMALPTPSAIEQALVARDYNSARSMVGEVLREKPDSAKGHLFNAYILAHADKNISAAKSELENVNRLDKKGDVKGSALFGRTLAEIESSTVIVTNKQQINTAQKYRDSVQPLVPREDKGVSGLYLIFVFTISGVVLFGGYKMYQAMTYKRTPIVYEQYRSYPNSREHVSSYDRPNYDVGAGAIPRSQRDGSTGAGAIPRREFRTETVYVQQPVSQAPMNPVVNQQGMGMMGTAASVAGGVVAGNMISDMMHSGRGSHHGHGSNFGDYEGENRAGGNGSMPRYSDREEVAPAVDYETTTSSFSSGSSSSWADSSPSVSSSSDSWGSSSSDSSSSDSGGGWDD